MSLEILSRQNPWWSQAESLEADIHLKALAASPLKWTPHAARDLIIDQDAVHIIRGPRQVGKTTLLKILIRSALRESGFSPQQVLYLDCERAGLRTPQEIAQLIETFRHWAPPSRHKLLLIDEATYVADWERGVKIAVDASGLEETTMIVTGSHAPRLKEGLERLPGRRGRGASRDLSLLPMTFREYVEALSPSLASIIHAMDSWDLKSWDEASVLAASQLDPLRSLFAHYLETGGFPIPVGEYLSSQALTDYPYELHRTAFTSELLRLGRQESFFRELVSWLMVRFENPFEWSDISRETAIGKQDTARAYVEDGEAVYLWDLLYQPKDLGRSFRAPRRTKRLYFKDPLVYQAFRTWSLGYGDPRRVCGDFLTDPVRAAYLVESVCASHLTRYGRPLFFWSQKDEIDFVLFQPKGHRLLFEVKYQNRIQPEDAKTVEQHGGGFLITKDFFNLKSGGRTLAIPAAIFLMLLPSEAG